MSDEDTVEDFLKCDVCKDIFNEPKTLLCQHTFCSTCLISLKECPMCRLKLYIPDKTNNLFDKIVGVLYDADKVKELQSRHRREKLEREITPKVIEEMNRNFNQTINTSGNNRGNRGNRENAGDNENSMFIGEEEPFIKVFGLKLKLNTFDYALKLIEIGFLAYYLYTFYLNYKIGGLTKYKIFVNLIIIFQSAYSLFYSSRSSQITNYNNYF
jgi:hypothetical protein